MYLFFLRLSRFMAYLGGVVLVALIVLTCLSIVGRSLAGMLHLDFFQNNMPDLATWLLHHGVGPIEGDFELVESGVAFAIFSFIPLCQIRGAHASVDIFTAAMSPRTNRILSWITDTVFAAVLVLIAVLLYSGTYSKYDTGQTTFLLEFPVWWSYAFSLIGAVVAAIVAIYVALIRTAEMVRGSEILPPESGAEH